jgi:mono/diheme cytochrome c family protein
LLNCIALLIALTGCVQEMANQPRYDTLEPIRAFPEGTAPLAPVAETIARSHLQLDEAFFTGKEQGQLVTEIPSQALDGSNMLQLMARGQQRYVVFCSHCHGQVGGGLGGDETMGELVGMVVQRGFPEPPTFHQARLRDAPVGYFFDVITNGFGRMPAHGYMIPPQDRWAIAAYIRALQFSQHAPRDQLTGLDLQQLETQSQQQ